jgi:excisionase family DNA binding protein
MNKHTQETPAAAATRMPLNRNLGNPAGGLDSLPLVSTKQQLASILTVSTKHIDNLTARGVLRATRLGRCVRYRRESVLRALAALEGGS